MFIHNIMKLKFRKRTLDNHSMECTKWCFKFQRGFNSFTLAVVHFMPELYPQTTGERKGKRWRRENSGLNKSTVLALHSTEDVGRKGEGEVIVRSKK